MGDREDLIDAVAHLAEEIADDVRREQIKQGEPKGAKQWPR